jgi:hypothetical protein
LVIGIAANVLLNQGVEKMKMAQIPGDFVQCTIDDRRAELEFILAACSDGKLLTT